MNKFLFSTLLVIGLNSTGFGQEIPLGNFPKGMRRPIADPAIYRLFLTHVAVFEREARRNQVGDESHDAFRNHIKNQFGLTPDEYLRIAAIALDFENQLTALKSRQHKIAAEFRSQKLVEVTARSFPPLPSELQKIHNKIEALTVHSCDQMKAELTGAQFTQLESALRKRDRFHLSFPREPGSRVHEAPGFTYGYTSIDFDPATKQVTAYAHTDMDGTLLPYYEPEVHVDRVTGLNSLLGNRGSDKEYASSCRTTAPDTVVCRFGGSLALYEVFAQHSLRLMASDSAARRWIDYANYGYVETFALLDRFEIPFFGPGPAQPFRDQSISIGQTWVATWWKGEK